MKYQGIFKKQHALLVVVHVTSEGQAIRNTQIAFDNRADGVFLIGHGMPADTLVSHSQAVIDYFPNQWIGVNFLGLNWTEALGKAHKLKCSGLWIDNVGYVEDDSHNADRLMEIRRLQRSIGNSAEEIKIFGGVAFKYQPVIKNPALAAKIWRVPIFL